MLSGLISQLRTDGGIFQAICFSNNLQTPTATDTRALPPGFGYYYLVREVGEFCNDNGRWTSGGPAEDPLREGLLLR